ncbi:MAG: hypothetical protein OHK0011_18970 [Turneriella sp.]
MKFLDIDIHKPDFQTLKAALELLADDYVILFPADKGLSVLGKAGGEAQKRFSAIVSSSAPPRLAVSEDMDLDRLAEGDITPYLPDYDTNRAFHTLVQLCDFPVLVAPAISDREAAATNYPNIEYGFWPL